MSDATTPGSSSESDAGTEEHFTNPEIDLLYVRDGEVLFDLKRGKHEWELATDTVLARLPEHQFEVVAAPRTFTIRYETVPSFVDEIDDTTGVLQVILSKGGTVVQLMAAIAFAFPGGLQFKQNGFFGVRSYD